jgi:hypothetical protein
MRELTMYGDTSTTTGSIVKLRTWLAINHAQLKTGDIVGFIEGAHGITGIFGTLKIFKVVMKDFEQVDDVSFEDRHLRMIHSRPWEAIDIRELAAQARLLLDNGYSIQPVKNCHDLGVGYAYEVM